MKNIISLPAILASTALFCIIFSGVCASHRAEAANVDEAETIRAGINTGTKCSPPEQFTLARKYVVKKGECLWWIAEYEDIFNDPFMWPLIYDANKEHMDNPDRIYPEQVLHIPRSGYTMDAIRDARRRAGASFPYTPPGDSLPPVD